MTIKFPKRSRCIKVSISMPERLAGDAKSEATTRMFSNFSGYIQELVRRDLRDRKTRVA